MNRLAVAVILGLALITAACDNAPSRADCEKLLDHTIELEQQAAGMTTGDPASQAQKQQLAETGREAFMDTCLGDLPRRRVACALKATTKAEMLICDDS